MIEVYSGTHILFTHFWLKNPRSAFFQMSLRLVLPEKVAFVSSPGFSPSEMLRTIRDGPRILCCEDLRITVTIWLPFYKKLKGFMVV
jgi:hypothetical protein